MADLGTLVWLRWRQWSRAGRYWLAVIGYDPGRGALMDRLYGAYVLAAMLAIAVIAWAGAVHAAWQAGQALAPTGAGKALAALLPWPVLGLQAVLAALALASSPLKLTAADMAHVAGAPLRRSAVVGVAFIRSLPAWLLAAAGGGDLASVVVAGSLHQQGAAAATAATLVLCSLALAWLLGALRVTGAAPRSGLWPLPPAAALLLAWRWPAVALWPGHVLAAAMTGAAGPWDPGLSVAAVGLVAGLLVVGERANMTSVAAESGLYARMRALGVSAWLDPTAARQVRLQARQQRRRARFALPAAAGTRWLLPARAALAYARLPGRLLALGADLSLTVLGCWVLLGRGAGLPWADWVLAVAIIPPRGVADVFDADTREPFLRQFLPLNDLALLAADAAAPAAAVFLLSVAAWLLRRPPSASIGAGVVCAAVVVTLHALCRAVAPARSGQAGSWRPPFILVAALCFGLVAAVAVPARDPGLALAIGAALAGALALVAARA